MHPKGKEVKAVSYKKSSRNILIKTYDFFLILADGPGKATEQKARENTKKT